MNELIAKLEKLAKKETLCDSDPDSVVYDYCGGNVDDAYCMGQKDGEIYLAREVLEALKISKEAEDD